MNRTYLWAPAVGVALALALGAPSTASADDASSYAWKVVNVGVSAKPATCAVGEHRVTLTGDGTGIGPKGNDRFAFVYVPREAGDFEIVTRLVDFNGNANHAQAGIMVRAGSDPSATDALMASAYYEYTANPLVPDCWLAKSEAGTLVTNPLPSNVPPPPPLTNLATTRVSANWKSRLPGASSQAPAQLLGDGDELAQTPPLWLRLVRVGKNVAAYKSRDGNIWVMMSNNSGGPVALDGPLQLGFFVASGEGQTPVTATFDSVTIGSPHLEYETSWAGNTFGTRAQDQHVSNSLSSLWVASDGTCYANSWWDEGGNPGTSYRDGKVWRGLPGGGPSSEGCIAGDDQHVYLAANDHITILDPKAPDFAPQSLALSVDLSDKKAGSVVSGMASNGKELFVADSRANLIRVATPNVTTYQNAEAANDRIEAAPAPVVVPENNPRFAPAVVYQTRRCGEQVHYRIPGLTPSSNYTVRCHLAAYSDKEPSMNMGKDSESINVVHQAGGALKAIVKDFPDNKTDVSGNLDFRFGGYGGALCGLEVLDPDGKRCFAINCGGPAIGDFKGESPEEIDRDFAFDRPGPMAIDKRGDLWIVQRGNDFPIGSGTSAKYPAAVKCYTTRGVFTGRQITDVVNPRALGYDAAKDELLVAENGPDLNIRIYGGLGTNPALDRTFGAKGGIFSGRHPGLLHDPEAGGDARFAGVAGVGVDAKGNLYVGGGFQGTDVRMFQPDGKLGWMLNSNMFCNTYDVDPASDGAEIYGTYNHLHLDLDKTDPGSEQQYIGYNWDVLHRGDPVRSGQSQAMVRRLGADKQRILFTSYQGQVGDINIYRSEGEIAVPCGAIRAGDVWIDADGDGVEQPNEVTKMATPISPSSLCVDAKGDIWAAVAPGDGACFMRHFTFQGMNAKGVPIYSGAQGVGYQDIPFPEEGAKVRAWSQTCKADYDAERDIMLAFYPTVSLINQQVNGQDHVVNTSQYVLGRYDHWSEGNRLPTWKVLVPTQETSPADFMFEVWKPFNCDGYMGMQMAGDYVFLAHLWGEIQVFDLKTGKLVKVLSMGPEVAGCSAWEDAAMGLRAFKRKNGEYLIFTENSGYGGKDNFIRWKP